MKKALVIFFTFILSGAFMPGCGNTDNSTDTTVFDSSPRDALATDVCGEYMPLQCGDRYSHHSLTEGRADEWSGYSCTAALMNGPETIYMLKTDNTCTVTITITEMESDLNVFRLSDCDPFTCTDVSVTPIDIQNDEIISFVSPAHTPQFIVVDGYDNAEGPYDIKVDCEK